jgi:hypothetical protein
MERVLSAKYAMFGKLFGEEAYFLCLVSAFDEERSLCPEDGRLHLSHERRRPSVFHLARYRKTGHRALDARVT